MSNKGDEEVDYKQGDYKQQGKCAQRQRPKEDARPSLHSETHSSDGRGYHNSDDLSADASHNMRDNVRPLSSRGGAHATLDRK